MNKFDPTKDYTYKEMLGPAMEIDNVEEAKQYLDLLIEYSMEKYNKTKQEASETWLNNIGYYAGYYGAETRRTIYTLFNTVHPIFGVEEPTTKEALEAGIGFIGNKDE